MIKYNIPMADYLAMPALSSGVAFRAITQSPLHAKYCQIAPDENCSAADKGTVAHRMLLENSEDGIVLIEADDWRTKAAKEMRDAAYAEGKIPLLYKQIGGIRAMVKAARSFVENSEIAGIFGKGNAEVTIDWNEGDLLCKARPDYLSDRFHISLKTTMASADPSSFVRRQLGPSGYDFAIEFYKRGLIANDRGNVQHRLLVVEQNPPYGCCLIGLDRSKIEMCGRMVDQAIRLWRECQKTGFYPGYSTETHFAEAKPWELAEVEERAYGMVGA